MRHLLTFNLHDNQLRHLDFVGYAIPTEDFSDRPVPDDFESISTASRLLTLDDVLNRCDVEFHGHKARLEGRQLVVTAFFDEQYVHQVSAAFEHYLYAIPKARSTSHA